MLGLDCQFLQKKKGGGEIWSFDRNCIEYVEKCGQYYYLTILSLPIQVIPMLLDLFRFSVISYNQILGLCLTSYFANLTQYILT